MMTPNRRLTDDYPLRVTVEWLKRYAIFWIPVLWIGSNLGFGIITPRLTGNQVKDLVEASTAKLQREIDTLGTRATHLEEVHRAIATDLSALVKFDCLDNRLSDRDKQLSNLRCDTR